VWSTEGGDIERHDMLIQSFENDAICTAVMREVQVDRQKGKGDNMNVLSLVMHEE
jgi:hypothetical protein